MLHHSTLRNLSASLALAVLGTVTTAPFAAALPEKADPPAPPVIAEVVQGPVYGRYMDVSTDTTVLQGLVRNAAGEAILRMDAKLLGTKQAGILRGRLVEMPSVPPGPSVLHLEYDVVGQYSRDANGVVHFEAQLFLDLRPQGIPWYVPAGSMHGALDSGRPLFPTQTGGAGDTPAPKPDLRRGTFRAHYEML